MKTLALTFLWLLFHYAGIAQNKLNEELISQLVATHDDAAPSEYSGTVDKC